MGVKWRGVDLDGTLAKCTGWKGIGHIGEPIPAMVERIKRWLAAGEVVKIMTARAHDEKAIPIIEDYCMELFGQILPVTNEKDPDMIELWDDKAIQVEKNTGQPIDPDLVNAIARVIK